MMIGDPTVWADKFKSLDTRLLERIIAVWPNCLAVLPDHPMEDTITVNLVHFLLQDSEARRLVYWIELQYEPTGYTSEGMAYSKGRIDMAVLLDQDRERYLAYECKRLNVSRSDGSRGSLATEYVMNGLFRFITEQYSKNLPVGCMLGYVLDGDTEFAYLKVCTAIGNNRKETGLTEQGIVAEQIQETSFGAVRRFSSYHLRPSSGMEIEIRHTLLPL